MITKDISRRRKGFLRFLGAVLLFVTATLSAVISVPEVVRYYPGFGGPPGLIRAAFAAGPWYCVLFLVSLAALVCAYLAFDAGRRLLAAHADEILSADPRPPIVYLRPDTDDNLKNPDNQFSELTYEEEMAKSFRGIGPFITVARPGESIPPTDAGRESFEMNWRERVQKLTEGAQLVVIDPTPTTACLWEIETCFRIRRPCEILLFFPFRKPIFRKDEREIRYQAVRSFLTNSFLIVLPKTLGRTVFIGFESFSVPIQYRQVQPWLPASRSSTQTNIRRTLAPVLTRLKKDRHTLATG
jgi:hypothetical protein